MLSYRHAFHAGNHADVLKHFVLMQVLTYIKQKDKPFDYIDTHSGAGFYNLKSEMAQKKTEYIDGIDRLTSAPDLPATLKDFVTHIQHATGARQMAYPGSPFIASEFLSRDDKAWLFELHPRDFQTLSRTFEGQRNIYCREEDGLKGLLSVVPPASRRACVLIDPSYEVKSDYDNVVATLKKAYRKFATGTYLLWYPVTDRARIDRLHKQLKQAEIKRVHCYELSVTEDSEGFGMTGSGMIVINPPWTLKTTMDEVLPQLANLLGEDEKGWFQSLILVDE